MKEITKEEITYMKRTLQNYYYLIAQEQMYLKLAMELQIELDQEITGKGMSYEDKSNGCSASYPSTPYTIQLVHEIRANDLAAGRCREKYKSLDKHNNLENRIVRLPNDQKMLITAILCKNESISDIAKKELVSRQAVTDRLDLAIERLLKMEVK